MTTNHLTCAILALVMSADLQGQTLNTSQWITDGVVYALATSGNTVYLGGQFSYVGPVSSANGAALNPTTGMPNSAFPSIDGTVVAAISDGAGGWYVGGYFSHVGSQTRNGVARINADGTLHAWNPNVSGGVVALALADNMVYIGGSFSEIDGVLRNNIAAVNASTGAPDLGWDPNADNAIDVLTVSATKVYVAGGFQNLGGNFSPNLAEIDRTTGSSSPGFPTPDIAPATVEFNDNTLFLGGTFTDVGGNPRSGLAAIDVSNGTVTSWDPAPNLPVHDLKVSGLSLYVAGEFDQIASAGRQYVAEFELSTGDLTSWQPTFNCWISGGYVQSISVSGGTVYGGGSFWHCTTPERIDLAAWDATTGSYTNWAPTNPPGTSINTVAVSGSQVYVGGTFTNIGGKRRNSLAAVDATTGAATDWNPNPVNEFGPTVIFAMTSTATTIYIGGEFTKVGGFSGTPRAGIAAIDATTGTQADWNPGISSGVALTLKLHGSLLYVGGEFQTIGGQSRNNLAAVDITTGIVTGWNPNPLGGSGVHDIEFFGNTAYIAGSFTSVGGEGRAGLAAVDLTTGTPTTFNPNPNIAALGTLALSDNTLYVGGSFNTIAGQARRGGCSFTLSAMNPNTETLTAFNPNVNPDVVWGGVSDILPAGTTVYIGGLFNSIGGQARYCLAELNAPDGSATSWNPPIINPLASGSQGIQAFATVGTKLFAAGKFDTVGTEPRGNMIAFDAAPLPVQLTNFTASLDQQHHVVLNWTTTSETNNYGFSIQTKMQSEFEWNEIPISFIPGHGTTLEPHHYVFTDARALVGGWQYRLKQIDLDGTAHISEPVSIDVVTTVGMNSVPKKFELEQNYPNPFNPKTTIQFTVGTNGHTSLRVFDLLGREVATLVNENLNAGSYAIGFDAKNLASGVYFYKLQTAGFTQTMKMILTR